MKIDYARQTHIFLDYLIENMEAGEDIDLEFMMDKLNF